MKSYSSRVVCLAGLVARDGDGGVGCSRHYDPADPGPGIVVATSAECAGPYEWTPCGGAEAPPECVCTP